MALRSLLEFIFTAKPVYFTNALQIAKPLGLGMRATPDQLLVIGMTAVLVLGASACHPHRDREGDAGRL
jgi:branched-chain amino acid transport system permease protein